MFRDYRIDLENQKVISKAAEDIWQTLYGLSKIEMLAFLYATGASEASLEHLKYERRFKLEFVQNISHVAAKLVDLNTGLQLAYAKGLTERYAAVALKAEVQRLVADAKAFIEEA